MSNDSNKVDISSLISDLVPEHINQSYPDFIEFLELFNKYLVSENRASHYINRIASQRDIDLVEETFLTNLQQEIGISVPRTFAADPRLFYTKLVQFYQSRGTPDSITSFFNILYDDEVEIYFPKEDMFVPSDNPWTDFSTDVIANPGTYSPSLTYTVSGATSEITGQDDNSFWLWYDVPIVFVNGTLNTNWKSSTYYRTYGGGSDDPDSSDNVTQTLAYKLTFSPALANADVVKIYRSGSSATSRSFVSDDKKIQDSYKYQKFSYILKTGANIDQWKNAFNRLVHPAGFIFFGEILLFIEILEKNRAGTVTPFAQPGLQLGAGLPVPIIIPPVEINAQAIATRTGHGVLSSHLGYTGDLATVYFTEGIVNTNTRQTNHLGPKQYLEDLKFLLPNPVSNFSDYTILNAINKTIDINATAEITIT
jgi:hypothetical protein|tara:strand:+ start:3918 stop:5189 length:1272 start_codon:yes stop_codon:yes gene_type:complete